MIREECGKGFCRSTSERECWFHHVTINGVAISPKKGTKRLRYSDVVELASFQVGSFLLDLIFRRQRQ